MGTLGLRTGGGGLGAAGALALPVRLDLFFDDDDMLQAGSDPPRLLELRRGAFHLRTVTGFPPWLYTETFGGFT